ncbi:MAG TPA: hypothetical protein VEL51_21520 [Vicinamibacterales bacterium]|nr:hypothetical protein [Vicinamibacterales bacterium]
MLIAKKPMWRRRVDRVAAQSCLPQELFERASVTHVQQHLRAAAVTATFQHGPQDAHEIAGVARRNAEHVTAFAKTAVADTYIRSPILNRLEISCRLARFQHVQRPSLRSRAGPHVVPDVAFVDQPTVRAIVSANRSRSLACSDVLESVADDWHKIIDIQRLFDDVDGTQLHRFDSDGCRQESADEYERPRQPFVVHHSNEFGTLYVRQSLIHEHQLETTLPRQGEALRSRIRRFDIHARESERPMDDFARSDIIVDGEDRWCMAEAGAVTWQVSGCFGFLPGHTGDCRHNRLEQRL